MRPEISDILVYLNDAVPAARKGYNVGHIHILLAPLATQIIKVTLL